MAAHSTLAGLVRWGRLSAWQRVLVALLYLLGYVVPPIVIVRGVQQVWRARQAQLAARPAQIAQLERELGLDERKRTGGMAE